jgi:hypothetical protein
MSHFQNMMLHRLVGSVGKIATGTRKSKSRNDGRCRSPSGAHDHSYRSVDVGRPL